MVKKIEVLGTGCPKCKKLADAAETAAREAGIPYELRKVTDIQEIIGYGIAMTPALVVDGKVVAAGYIPSNDQLKEMLQ
jgi:small redox-active disulfide protein 2